MCIFSIWDKCICGRMLKLELIGSGFLHVRDLHVLLMCVFIWGLYLVSMLSVALVRRLFLKYNCSKFGHINNRCKVTGFIPALHFNKQHARIQIRNEVYILQLCERCKLNLSE